VGKCLLRGQCVCCEAESEIDAVEEEEDYRPATKKKKG
jgi:hypothetical protein